MSTSLPPPHDITTNLKRRIPDIIIASFTIVAGLAWNDAITAIINYYVPDNYKSSTNAWFKVIYASILTTIIVIFITVILKYSPK